MKISILTLHNIVNVGSVFQAWALNRFLIDNGYDCEVVDYTPQYLYHLGLKSEIGKLLNIKDYLSKNKKYNDFVHKNMILSNYNYTNYAELKKNPPNSDLFISGGDQLWNEFYPCGNDIAYQLAFTNCPKIAYGTSLGKSTFSESGMNKLINNISAYKSIGIRESSGVALLKRAGLKNVFNVCDPVFLLSKENYCEFIKEPLYKEPYLFVYLVDSSPLLDVAVNVISERLGLKVILCSGFRTKTKCDIHLKDLGPIESINYLKNASYVLSGSFHATAFSIMMHKPFLTLLPGVNTNARIEDFLHLLGLEDRMIADKKYLTQKIFEPINWNSVDALLDNHIANSKRFLLTSIDNLS